MSVEEDLSLTSTGNDNINHTKYQQTIDSDVDDFKRRYGDPTHVDFDHVSFRRKLADEAIAKPNKDWVNQSDPVKLRHEELIYRLVMQQKSVDSVMNKMSSMQDQFDKVTDRLSSIERCVSRVSNYVEVVVRELREQQHENELIHDSNRDNNLVEEN